VTVRLSSGHVLLDDDSLADHGIPDVGHDPWVPQHIGKRVRVVREPETNGGHWCELEVREWNVWRVIDGKSVTVRDPLAQKLGRQGEHCQSSQQRG
jgi:hypothetical protein